MHARIKESLLILSLIATGLGVSLQVRAQSRFPAPEPVESRIKPHIIAQRAPLSSVAELFQRIYGKVVTYEDAILEFTGDRAALLLPGARVPTPDMPRELSFKIPVDSDQERDIGRALEQTLASYNAESGGPRYRLVISKLGYHLIPSQVRNPQGQWIPARNPLDRLVSIPVEERTASGHLMTIIQAVGSAEGIHYEFQWGGTLARVRRNRDVFGEYFGTTEKFAWGAQVAEVARNLLIELLEKSETSFRWEVNCGLEAGKPRCFPAISPVGIVATQLDGTTVLRQLDHDRCPKCSPAEADAKGKQR